jgi:hypothetical protein
LTWRCSLLLQLHYVWVEHWWWWEWYLMETWLCIVWLPGLHWIWAIEVVIEDV